jgi:hypothetical protein
MTTELDKVSDEFPVEIVPTARLKPHPRNYRAHPDDEVEHLMASVREHGLYRNVVIARDDTILAGHGVVAAMRRLGRETIAVRRLDLDPEDPRAVKVLVADNTIAHLAVVDDRALSELLREIKDSTAEGLLGTGYDDMMLANLVFVTRPEGEITDLDRAAQWVGMPEYDAEGVELKVTVHFRSEQDRAEFARLLGLSLSESRSASTWWPPLERKDDVQSVRFVESGEPEAAVAS